MNEGKKQSMLLKVWHSLLLQHSELTYPGRSSKKEKFTQSGEIQSTQLFYTVLN